MPLSNPPHSHTLLSLVSVKRGTPRGTWDDERGITKIHWGLFRNDYPTATDWLAVRGSLAARS